MRIYLAGAIENTDDGGSTWRQDITPKLKSIGCSVFDPCVHTDGMLAARELGWQSFSFAAWKNLRQIDPHEYYRVGKLIRREDLSEVTKSDVVIVRMDKLTCTSDGTCGEMTVAALFRIPVFVFFVDGVNHYNVPAWKVWCADEFFQNEKEILEKLHKITNP